MSNRPEQIFVLDTISSRSDGLQCSNGILAKSQLNLNNVQNLSKTCRICATSTELVLPIFEKEGLENKLADKVNKYLPIKVFQDDQLPQVICYQCSTTIISWHEFVTSCVQANATLRTKIGCSPVLHNASKETESEKRSKISNIEIDQSLLESLKEVIFDLFNDITVKEDCGIQFTCSKCNDVQFSYIEDLADHLQNAHTSSIINKANLETFVKEHIAFQSNSERKGKAYGHRRTSFINYLCKHCERRFTSIVRLTRHLSTHFNINFESGVTCCDYVYDDKKSFTLHLQNDHIDNAVDAFLSCKSCGLRVQDAATLRAHVQAEHAAAEKTKSSKLGINNQKNIPAVCPQCNKTFSNIYNMMSHMRSHSEAQSLQCDDCGRRYSTRGNLAAHVRAVHGAEKGKVCPHCGELFTRSGDLKRHVTRHSAPTLRCSRCPATFHFADSLRRHTHMHFDVRPHSCPRCGRAFRQKSHLAAHTHSNACRLLQT